MITPVSFETAKLVFTKIGYIPSKKVYDNGKLKNKPSWGLSSISDYKDRFVYAPTIAEVVMWIHEKYGIWIGVNKNYAKAPTFWNCITLSKSVVSTKPNSFITAEEAYEAAIEYILNELI